MFSHVILLRLYLKYSLVWLAFHLYILNAFTVKLYLFVKCFDECINPAYALS